MPLENIENGTLADADVVNNNFNYLDDRITDTVSKIYTNNSSLDSKVVNLKTYLEGSINTNIATVNNSINSVQTFANGLNTRIRTLETNPYPTPTMIPLIDWTNMAFKANVADVRTINNATTGIKAYSGSQAPLNKGDIYLKENFTNYQRIMVVWTDDSGVYLGNTIWESWELDYLLNQTKGRVSIIVPSISTYYWDVYGYGYSATISSVAYSTNKKYFLTNAQQNCGIVEIYGLR